MDQMMTNEGVLFVLLSIASCICLILVAAICVCGCRKKVPKNELLGLEGMVKITNPDENVNHVTVIDQTPSGITEIKIKSGVEPPPRRLPPIPNDSDALVVEIDANAVGDGGSDIYATVGHKGQTFPKGSPNTCNKHPSGLERPSLSQHSSLSQGDDISSTYATVKSPHAYDKVGRSEHAYATLHSGGNTVNNADEITTGIHEHSTMLDPSAPSRSRRASSQSLTSNNGQNSTAPTTIDISAAPAIAGRVSANQELPYMTPPLIAPQHFSGDSQDSSKGYTSISVREPLAILAQNSQNTSNGNRRIDRSDSHYATVSDDSDEMYAAIDDPNPQSDLYTSGSETYAQIQPPIVPVDNITVIPAAAPLVLDTNISAVSMQHQSRLSQISSSDSDAPHPPSVNNLRHLAQVHSRQASSSSCSSSVVNLGSPKPEKRQANSPLPPPPPNLLDPNRNKFNVLVETNKYNNTSAITRNSTSDLYDIARLGSTNDKHRRNYSSMSHNELQGFKKYSNESTQIDKSKLLQEGEIAQEIELLNNESSTKSSDGVKHLSPAKTLEEMYAKVVKKNKNLSNFNEKSLTETKNEDPDSIVSNLRDNISNNITKTKDLSNNESIYGSDPEIALDVNLDLYNKNILPHGSQGGDINYSNKNKNIDPSYETIKKAISSEKDPGYETIGKNITPVDPGYETLKDRSKNCTESQNLDHNTSSSTRYSYNSLRIPGTLTELSTTEPGYESLPGALDSFVNDPGYEAIQKSKCIRPSAGSDCDPNYEVLRHTTRSNQLQDIDVTNSEYSSLSDVDGTPNYSSIKEVHSDGYSSISEVKSNMHDKASLIQAGYSVVNKKNKNCDTVTEEPNYESMPTNYTTGSESDPNYESVKYLDIDTEPPYERLHNESPVAQSALSNSEHTSRDREGNLNDNTDCTKYETVNNKNKPGTQGNARTDNIENVDDYFHV